MANTELLLSTAADEMGIVKGTGEAREQWIMRVIYSAIGRMAYAALWDYGDDEEDASVVHFKERVSELLNIWKRLYSQTIKNFLYTSDDLSEYLLKLYSETGVLYHHPHRVLPAIETATKLNNCVFVRSPKLNQDMMVSGLGYYLKEEDFQRANKERYVYADPYAMFSIDSHRLEEIAEYHISNCSFRRFEGTTDDVEYLRLTPPFSRGYWKLQPDMDGTVSLFRLKTAGAKIYYLYKYVDKELMVSQLPEWLCAGYEYRTISWALMKNNNTVPGIHCSTKGELVYIRQEYLLPPPELNLLLLYSWPVNYSKTESPFIRVMAKPCFDALEVLLKRKGYLFVREQKI